MHIVALALLALVLGFVHSFIAPKLQAVIPSNLQQGMLLQSFFTGAIILVALFLSGFALRAVGMKERV